MDDFLAEKEKQVHVHTMLLSKNNPHNLASRAPAASEPASPAAHSVSAPPPCVPVPSLHPISVQYETQRTVMTVDGGHSDLIPPGAGTETDAAAGATDVEAGGTEPGSERRVEAEGQGSGQGGGQRWSGLPRVRSHALFLDADDEAAGADGIIVPKQISLIEGSPDLLYDSGCHAMQGASTRMEDRVLLLDLSAHPHFAGCHRAVLLAVLDGHAGVDAVSYLENHLTPHLLEEVARQLGCPPLYDNWAGGGGATEAAPYGTVSVATAAAEEPSGAFGGAWAVDERTELRQEQKAVFGRAESARYSDGGFVVHSGGLGQDCHDRQQLQQQRLTEGGEEGQGLGFGLLSIGCGLSDSEGEGDGGSTPPGAPPRRHSAATERRRSSLAMYGSGTCCSPPDPSAALRNALLRCERELMDQDCRSGSTALVGLMLGAGLWLANVGDCRAVVCDDGEARQLTVDHKAVSGCPGESGEGAGGGAAVMERRRLQALGVQLSTDGYLQVTGPDGSCSDLAVSRNLGCAHLKNRATSGRGWGLVGGKGGAIHTHTHTHARLHTHHHHNHHHNHHNQSPHNNNNQHRHQHMHAGYSSPILIQSAHGHSYSQNHSHGQNPVAGPHGAHHYPSRSHQGDESHRQHTHTHHYHNHHNNHQPAQLSHQFSPPPPHHYGNHHYRQPQQHYTPPSSAAARGADLPSATGSESAGDGSRGGRAVGGIAIDVRSLPGCTGSGFVSQKGGPGAMEGAAAGVAVEGSSGSGWPLGQSPPWALQRRSAQPTLSSPSFAAGGRFASTSDPSILDTAVAGILSGGSSPCGRSHLRDSLPGPVALQPHGQQNPHGPYSSATPAVAVPIRKRPASLSSAASAAVLSSSPMVLSLSPGPTGLPPLPPGSARSFSSGQVILGHVVQPHRIVHPVRSPSQHQGLLQLGLQNLRLQQQQNQHPPGEAGCSHQHLQTRRSSSSGSGSSTNTSSSGGDADGGSSGVGGNRSPTTSSVGSRTLLYTRLSPLVEASSSGADGNGTSGGEDGGRGWGLHGGRSSGGSGGLVGAGSVRGSSSVAAEGTRVSPGMIAAAATEGAEAGGIVNGGSHSLKRGAAATSTGGVVTALRTSVTFTEWTLSTSVFVQSTSIAERAVSGDGEGSLEVAAAGMGATNTRHEPSVCDSNGGGGSGGGMCVWPDPRNSSCGGCPSSAADGDGDGGGGVDAGAAATAAALIPDPDLFYYQISQESEFLICACDGLWDVMRNGEACRMVRRWLADGRSATGAAEALCQTALRLGSQDNISAVVLRFSTRPLASAPSRSVLRRVVSEAGI